MGSDDAWTRLEQQIAELLNIGSRSRALEQLDAFLTKDHPAASRSAALSYRASVKEDLGDYTGAWNDELSAHELSKPATYTRYTLELSLARLSAICGHREQTMSWLIAALTTARNGDHISGGVALHRFLELKAETALEPAERSLCLDVAKRSWHVLQQPGEPDVADLNRLAKLLVELGAAG